MRITAFLCLFALTLRADDMALLRGSLGELRKGSPAAAREALPGSPADQIAMRMPLADSRTPWRARYVAAEWLLLAHLRRLRMEPVPPLTRDQQDLTKAWLLIQSAFDQSRDLVPGGAGLDLYRGANPGARVSAAVALSNAVGQEKVPDGLTAAMTSLAVEISARLKNPAFMAKAAAYAALRPDLPPRDKAFALVAAAHGGDWTNAARWLRELEGNRMLAAFHQSALADPAAFDYSALGTVLPPQASQAPPLLDSARYSVKEARFKTRYVRGPEAQTAPLRAALGRDWTATGPVAHPLLRVGSTAHWLKPGAQNVPLTGPASPHRLDLGGYTEFPGGGVQTEILSLLESPDRPGFWTGTLLVRQPSAEGPLEIAFEAQLETEADTATGEPGSR